MGLFNVCLFYLINIAIVWLLSGCWAPVILQKSPLLSIPAVHHNDKCSKRTNTAKSLLFIFSSYASIHRSSSFSLSRKISASATGNKTQTSDQSPRISADFCFLFPFLSTSFRGHLTGPVPCSTLTIRTRGLEFGDTSLEDTRGQMSTHTRTHTDRGSRETKGSHGDKPFPLFSNYQPFSSALRLITSRPGMTFGNGWRGPAQRCTLLLLLLLSVMRAAH